MTVSKRIIPVLLLGDEGLCKTRRFQEPIYVGDPLNAVHIFNEKEVDELIILDITEEAQKNGPRFDVLEDLASEVFAPMAYGGGISTMQHAEQLMRLGFDKLSFSSALYRNPGLVRLAAQTFGAQSVIGCIDVKKTASREYNVMYDRGQKKASTDILDYLAYVEGLGVGELLVNDITKDGTLSGYDFTLHAKVAESVKIPVVACGGAHSSSNIAKLFAKTKVCAAACGAFFVFYGPYRAVLITYPGHATKKEMCGAS